MGGVRATGMNVVGLEYLLSQIAQGGFSAKAVFNQHGVIFFPVDQQHRDQKAPGISYADESAGNALAAMLSPGRFEIRNHRDFSPEHVAELVTVLLKHAELSSLKAWRVTYRGQVIASAT